MAVHPYTYPGISGEGMIENLRAVQFCRQVSLRIFFLLLIIHFQSFPYGTYSVLSNQ